jgi:N,N'-diacetyllegionaminate synthase
MSNTLSRLTDSTLIVAEIGVNHDGSESRALELVDAARAAGADAVKLQLFKADRLMHPRSAFAKYQADRVSDASPADMLRRYELSDAAAARITRHIKQSGLLVVITPFSPGDLKLLAALKPAFIKIASPDLVNPLLLRDAAKLRRPMLVSTGASTLAEIAATATWLKTWKANFALLHCISSYPTPSDQAHLSWLRHLSQFKVPLGYSDHTTDPQAGALAVAAGAVIIEKHLTYDRHAPGPDHSASFDPTEFAQYVQSIRYAELLLGRGSRRVLPIERDVRKVSRQSLVLSRSVKANQPLTLRALTVQRPGTGIPVAHLNQILRRRAARNLEAGTMLARNDLKK